MQGPPLAVCGGEVLRDSKNYKAPGCILQGANMAAGREALWLAHGRPRERPLVPLHRVLLGASPFAGYYKE